ncbi:hypothetical protein EDD90_8098 [Streptomyces sp. Ag109_O5-1]|nr:hypothetical protein EDD90_8098 [Streptomyces sp. Ag109_O5-1]
MIPARTGIGWGSGQRRSRRRMPYPPGRHSLELTGKELRS